MINTHSISEITIGTKSNTQRLLYQLKYGAAMNTITKEEYLRIPKARQVDPAVLNKLDVHTLLSILLVSHLDIDVKNRIGDHLTNHRLAVYAATDETNGDSETAAQADLNNESLSSEEYLKNQPVLQLVAYLLRDDLLYAIKRKIFVILVEKLKQAPDQIVPAKTPEHASYLLNNVPEDVKDGMARHGLEPEGPSQQEAGKLYSSNGNAIWITSYVIIGIAVFILLMSGFSKFLEEESTRTTIISVIVSLIFVSFGFLMSGLRDLANLKSKSKNENAPSGMIYIVWGIFWVFVAMEIIGYTIYYYAKLAEWDKELALKVSLIPLLFTFIPVALSSAFFLIAHEIVSKE